MRVEVKACGGLSLGAHAVVYRKLAGTALHTFMARWNGKRPLPWDMFNSFNDAGVGNYNWFFRNWFFSYNYIDLALDGLALLTGREAGTANASASTKPRRIPCRPSCQTSRRAKGQSPAAGRGR